MNQSVACPACRHALAENVDAGSPPTCPHCGARVLCSACGSRLEKRPDETAELFCMRCQAPATRGDSTMTDSGPPVAPSVPSLPGFEVLGELGRGGMGIVYRARQVHLDREVALKVLPPALAAQSHLMQRFRNEAAVAAKLVSANILPVFDVQEFQGAPVLIMPLVKGCDLGRIVRDRAASKEGGRPPYPHPWAQLDDAAYLAQVLPVLDQVVTAVAALHQEGVIHRDVKPSNVLIDEWGKAWLSDFGLARFEEEGVGTLTGQGMGTPGYMSPEQTAGVKDLDNRTDLFSLGVTLYQALTLDLPYGKKHVADHGPPPVAPSRRQPLLSRDFDTVILKPLERNRDDRYGSATELQDDWQRVRQGLLPRARKVGRTQRLLRTARRHPAQSVLALTAFLLIATLAAIAAHRAPDGTRSVRIETTLPGARIALVPIDPDTGEHLVDRIIRPREPSPLTLKRVPPGEYFVVAEVQGFGFHEVIRTVPAVGTPRAESLLEHQFWRENEDGTIVWPLISIVQHDKLVKAMAFFAGGSFRMGSASLPDTPPHQKDVPAFYLEPHEVTEKEFTQMADTTRPAPPLQRDDFPVASVSYDQALAYAERVGKRLPDEAEYEFAATNGGKEAFPWGDDATLLKDWTFGPVHEPSFDRTNTKTPVYGLYSNVAEWTSSKYAPYPGMPADLAARAKGSPLVRRGFDNAFVVRGGRYCVVQGTPDVKDGSPQWTPRHRFALKRDDATYSGLGFRCARSASPRY